MAKYTVTDPKSGRKVTLTGDSPPTEQELEDIFSSLPGKQQESVAEPQQKKQSYMQSALQNIGTPSQQAAQSSNVAAQQSASDRQSQMESLRRTNPYLAAQIEEMSPVQKGLTLIGGGLTDVYAGLPFTQSKSSDELSNISALENTTAGGSALRGVGQAAPFVPLSLAGGFAGLPARAAYQTGVGGLEGADIAKGTGQDNSGILQGALAGAALGGGGEAVLSGLNRALVPLKPTQSVSQGTDMVPSFEQVAETTKAPTAQEAITPATGSDRALRNQERQAAFEKLGLTPTEAQRTRDKDLFNAQQDRARQGGQVSQALDTQEQQLNEKVRNVVTDTGGNENAAPNSVIDAITNKSLKQDAAISEAYKTARESAPDAMNVKFNNASKVLRQFAGDNELSGGVISSLKSTMEQSGALDGFKPVGRVSVDSAEKIRQQANSLFSSTNPQGKAILRQFKDAIDNDVANAAGEDVFKSARKAKADFESGLDRDKLHKFDSRNVNIVRDLLDNTVTPDQIQQGILVNAGSKYKAQDLKELHNYLHSGDTQDIAAGQQAWNDVRASAMQVISDKAFKGAVTEQGTQSLSRAGLDQALNSIGKQKFDVLFSPKEKQFLYDLSTVAKYKEPPPGTFTGSGPSSPAIDKLISKVETIYGARLPIASNIKGALAERRVLKLNDDLAKIERENLIKSMRPYSALGSAAITTGATASTNKED